MILPISVIILLLSSANAAPAGETDAFLSMLEKANLLAATVAISKDDSIPGLAFSKGYGMANYALGVKMKPKYRMTIGSNTKFMTAVSIYQLHQRGLLNVDDPVSKYLAPADFGRPANWTWCPRVYNTTGTKCTGPSIRHTLSMASGVVRVDNCPYSSDMWQYKLCIDQQPGGKAMGNDVYLPIVGQIPIVPYIKLILDAPLEFAPGTGYAYSNPGWWLASYIVEKISGMPLNLYYQKYLWDPSGMTNTYYGVGLDTYSVHPNSIAGVGYANLFAPYGALLTIPQYGGFMIDPRQAKGVGSLPLPPAAPAGTFQGTVQTPWYSGELGMGNGAGAVVSDTADMIKWFKTFIAKPDRLGLNVTTLKNMFSYYNPYSALPSGAYEGNKANVLGYFGPGIAVVPGAGGLYGMSQLMYQGDIAGVACRVHIRLRGAHPSNSTVIVYFVPLVPAIAIPPNGTKDCLVKDPLAPTKPAERLPQLLCDVTAWPTFTIYMASNLTKIWGF